MLSHGWLTRCADQYRASLAATDPLVSPLYAHLRGLPPILIQVGSEEILLSDAEQLAENARKAGLRVELQVFKDMWHIFQVHAGVLKESNQAVKQIGMFVGQMTAAIEKLDYA
jgi:acetyl esterase/lipase